MSGALGAMIASVSRARVFVTLADQGAAIGAGSFSPGAVPVRTTSLLAVDYITGASTLRIFLDTVLSQSYFHSLRIQDGAGAIQVLNSADASFFSTAGSQTQWHWTPASFWAAGDVGELKLLEFVF